MKKTLTLLTPMWAFFLIGCGGNNKHSAPSSIDNQPEHAPVISLEGIKQKYTQGEEIDVKIAESNRLHIDSVQYYINDHLIATVKDSRPVRYTLSREKFGKQILKVSVFNKGASIENAISVDYLPPTPPRILRYKIINTYPHDITAFTQGLEFYGDQLMESTGNGIGASGHKGKSSIRMVNPKTGIPTKKVELPDAIFGEGATILNGKLYQLTYKNNLAFVYDINTFNRVKTLPYFQQMEGWGLTCDGQKLYMSDGSEHIYLINPEDFSKIDYIRVATDEKIVDHINEMEWVHGKIYANFFMENIIGIIDPKTGAIEALADLSELREQVTQHIDLDVLNGIAYNKKSKTFFITGKNWDKIFEISLFDELP